MNPNDPNVVLLELVAKRLGETMCPKDSVAMRRALPSGYEGRTTQQGVAAQPRRLRHSLMA